jgi:hypothetical protein
MTRVKRGLTTLGLLIAALGLMSLMAAGAQAVFDVNGKPVAAELKAKVEARIEANAQNLLLTTNHLGQPLVIHCKELSLTEGTLLSGGVAHATIQYNNSTCLTLVNGVDQANCSGATGINILPVKVIFEPKLHATFGVLLLAKPLTAGSSFTQIDYGPFCSLPPVSPTGTVAFSCAGGCAVSKTVHLLTPVADALLGDGLKYGANPATLDGPTEVFLMGDPHNNASFNAL